MEKSRVGLIDVNTRKPVWVVGVLMSFMLTSFFCLSLHSEELTQYEYLEEIFDARHVCNGNVCGVNKVISPYFPKDMTQYEGVCYSNYEPNSQVDIGMISWLHEKGAARNPHKFHFISDNNDYLDTNSNVSELTMVGRTDNREGRLVGSYTNQMGQNVKVGIARYKYDSNPFIVRLQVEIPGIFNDKIYFCEIEERDTSP